MVVVFWRLAEGEEGEEEVMVWGWLRWMGWRGRMQLLVTGWMRRAEVVAFDASVRWYGGSNIY